MSQFSDEPIVDVEKRTKEVGQILGDPTLFPVEFLNWLKRYLEQSGMQLPASCDHRRLQARLGLAPEPGGGAHHPLRRRDARPRVAPLRRAHASRGTPIRS